MSQSPALSILIVNWNGKEILRNLLASIERARGDLLVQTIVVDNASADGSAELAAAEFPGVILHRNGQNLGFARGNNQAARSAAAPLLLLLNNDTIVRAGALQKLVQFMNENPDVVAAGPRLIGADGKPQRSGRNLPTVAALLNSIQFLKWTGLFRRAYRQYRSEGFDPEKEGTVAQLAAAALVIRRDGFERIGGFDEGFAFGVEDVRSLPPPPRPRPHLLSPDSGDRASRPHQLPRQSRFRLPQLRMRLGEISLKTPRTLDSLAVQNTGDVGHADSRHSAGDSIRDAESIGPRRESRAHVGPVEGRGPFHGDRLAVILAELRSWSDLAGILTLKQPTNRLWRTFTIGGVAEWSNAPVLKTGGPVRGP